MALSLYLSDHTIKIEPIILCNRISDFHGGSIKSEIPLPVI